MVWYRVCPGIAFRFVYVISGSFSAPLIEYAVSGAGEGLILIDNRAAAEMCPILPRAAYMFCDSTAAAQGIRAADLEANTLPTEVMRHSPRNSSMGPSACFGSTAEAARNRRASQVVQRPGMPRSLPRSRWPCPALSRAHSSYRICRIGFAG